MGMKAEQWRQIILSFQSEKTYDNPFLDVSVLGIFTGPSGRKIRREAYWDGGNTYRIAFAPTETGMWSYRLEAPEETGLSGVQGTIECIPYEGKLAIYQHGFLKVHPSGKYLTYADGTPFFWLGDTHWEFAFGERWDESNHPQMTSMFRGMADRRKAQGYNVYQTNLRSDSWPGAAEPLLGGRCRGRCAECGILSERARPPYAVSCGSRLRQRTWFCLVRLDRAGRGASETSGALHHRALRRPSGCVDTGRRSGRLLPGEPRERAIKGWREVAEYVEEMDGYDTLQTAHYTNERPFADYYYDEPWFDFVLNQAGHGDFPINVSWYRSYQKEHGTKPFIEGESLYEYCSTLEENGTRLCTDAMLRRVAYMAIQAGGCGYTYGAQGIWDNIWEVSDINPDFNAFNKFGITWAKAIDGPGGAQMGYLKRFYEEHHFEEMVPYDPAEAEENISPFSNKLAAATISRDKTRALIYYGEMDGMSTQIAGLCDGIYAVSWFDPRTGETEKAEEQVEVRQKSCIMPKKPAAGDWMLIAECIEKTEK